MDVSSQQVVLLLNAFATIVDQLQSFGYALYLDTQAPSWTQPRAITVSGEGFQIFQNSQRLRFDRALLTGCALQYDTAATHELIFSILFAWNA